jgi:hypothetical protein
MEGTASDKAALIRAAIDALKMVEVLTGGVRDRREQPSSRRVWRKRRSRRCGRLRLRGGQVRLCA